MNVVNISFKPEVSVGQQVASINEIERLMCIEDMHSYFRANAMAARIRVQENRLDDLFTELAAMDGVLYEIPRMSPLWLAVFRD